MSLSVREQFMLEFEGNWWTKRGSKDLLIRENFQLSPGRYYQLLSELIEREDALEFAPLVVRRLLRLRDRREQARLNVNPASTPV